MSIAVIGLGKIGLPLAAQYARKGHHVIGVDIDAGVVDSVNSALEPFPGERDLAEVLAEVVPAGRLRATTDYGEAIPHVETVVVAVPLFVDGNDQPDFAIMDAATISIAEHLTPGTLVLFETTLPVGTTRNRLAPLLEKGSGLAAGEHFHVVFSPERVLTGRVFQDLRRYPKIVGGLEPEGGRRASNFYEAVLDFDDRPDLPRANGVWDVGSAEAAELTKLAETTYRDVNIALANQFAKFAEASGIDVHEVIAAANSQPYSHIHKPGIAVGGHCIPVYPRLYLFNDPEAGVVRAARTTNAGMPEHVVARLEKEFGSLTGARVAVLGAAYRGGVKETAYSGVYPTVEALETAGAVVTVHDPLYDDQELLSLGLKPHHLGEPVDAAIVQADHEDYANLDGTDLPGVKVVVDGRSVVDSGPSSAAVIVLGRAADDSGS